MIMVSVTVTCGNQFQFANLYYKNLGWLLWVTVFYITLRFKKHKKCVVFTRSQKSVLRADKKT